MIYIVAYAFESAIHCVDCTEQRFGGKPKIDQTDKDGNPIHPIFSIDEIENNREWCDTGQHAFNVKD